MYPHLYTCKVSSKNINANKWFFLSFGVNYWILPKFQNFKNLRKLRKYIRNIIKILKNTKISIIRTWLSVCTVLSFIRVLLRISYSTKYNSYKFFFKIFHWIFFRSLNHPVLGSRITKTIFKLWNGLKSDFSDRSGPRRNHLKQFQCARDHREMGVNIIVSIKLDIKWGQPIYKDKFCQVVTSEKKNYVYTTIFTWK